MPAEIFADGDQDYIEKFNTVAQQAFDGDAAAGRLDDHIDGTADKHGASAIVNTPAGSIAATDVQAAINELDTEKQPIDATLTALAGVTTAADKLIYATGADAFATTDLTSAGRALLDDADASAQRTTLGLGTAATLASDTDTSLAANSDTRLATQKAVKAYVDALIAASDAVVFRGVTDCSANPNYPAADAGHLYIVSVAGKIGGASGVVVEAGDMFICKVDSTASGNQATVGANWSVIQTNINGAVVGPSSAGDSRVVMFDGTTGKLIKDSGLTLSGTNTGDQTSVTGNAGSATILQTARNINGVSFNGSADITVTAAAGTLTGATLAAGVTASSLTSVGTLTSLTTSGQITSSLSTGTAPFSVASTTNVANLNASSLSGATFAAPGTIGGGTPGAATFTTVAASGTVRIGATPTVNPAALLFIQSDTDNVANFGSQVNVGSAGAVNIVLRKSRGTNASQTIVQSADSMGLLAMFGYDGAAYIRGAEIRADVDGTPGLNDMPGRLTFSTTLDGAAGVTERMRIDNAGVVTIGAAPGAESLRVTPVSSAVNGLNVSGATTGNAVTIATAGSDANRGVTLTTAGTGVMTLALNSLAAAKFSSTSVAGAQYMDFTYSSGINEMKLVAAGSANIGFSSTGGGVINFYTNVTLEQQVGILRTASANRYLTLTGSNGGNPAIGASAGGVQFTAIPILPSYTVGTLPAVTAAGGMIYVSNESGGAVQAFSDGTNWRRVTDRAIVS